ncbi:threonine synthase [Selenomonas sp. AB3002]|uniref:threonine synthase n=1 Tax=Selenomonas sp. AB3002 TaxID=1392502 RepID=UPI000497488D
MMKEAIDLKYSSTRGKAEICDSAEAIIKGLAADGGLFVPEAFPQVSLQDIEAMVPLSYEERAVKVLSLFLTDYTKEEVAGCVSRAYGSGKFDTERRAPVNSMGDFHVLELWHGPTSAFKDMALQLLPQLLSTALPKCQVQDQVLILVATSGDTGKAALEGFADVEQTRIMVFYPQDGVSRIQQLQMLTQQGGNVKVMAVQGNFDDAQSGVKAIFSDEEFARTLAEKGVRLSSANSINWGRLVPQIVYYFSAYADLLAEGAIKAGDEIDFTVPTGNFGDILAAYYAKRMGLPVHKLICASNANNVLTEFLRTGIYDRQRDFFKTITPSMDILISSNLERLLYHVTEDSAKVAGWMKQLSGQGSYEVDKETLNAIQELFWADWVSDTETKAEIDAVYRKHKYVMDTHTAVAAKVAEKYAEANPQDKCPMVIVSTASPYKFNGSVLEALGAETEGLDEFQLLDKLHEVSGQAIPQGLAKLRHAEVLHQGSCRAGEMKDTVLEFAAGKVF